MDCTTQEIKLYQMVQRSIIDTISEVYGAAETKKLLRVASVKTGVNFAGEYMDLSVKLFPFIRQMQKMFQDLKVGIIKIERAGSGRLELLLDCSMNGHALYNFSEGFLTGVLDAYMGKNNSLSYYFIRLLV